MANLAKTAQANRITKVERSRLLDTLRENKKKHIQEYEAALAGYSEMAKIKAEDLFKSAEQQLKEARENFNKNIEKFDPNDSKTAEKISGIIIQGIYLDLPVPKNFSEAYDTAITQMDWETEDIVEITTAEIECFIRDRWDWSLEFTMSNSMYLDS